MQVRDVVAKDIDVDLLGIGGLAQGAGDAGEDCAQRGGFWSVQLGNERDVAAGLKVGDPGIGPCVTQESRHKVSCHTRVRWK